MPDNLFCIQQQEEQRTQTTTCPLPAHVNLPIERTIDLISRRRRLQRQLLPLLISFLFTKEIMQFAFVSFGGSVLVLGTSSTGKRKHGTVEAGQWELANKI